MNQNSDKLYVVMRSRKKLFFEGSAASVTSLNDKGDFDVLPQHANFISLVKKSVILNKSQTNEQKYAITTGVLRVKQNKVEIFLDV